MSEGGEGRKWKLEMEDVALERSEIYMKRDKFTSGRIGKGKVKANYNIIDNFVCVKHIPLSSGTSWEIRTTKIKIASRTKVFGNNNKKSIPHVFH